MAIKSIQVQTNQWPRSTTGLEVGDKLLTIKGSFVKTATIHDEWWLETELDDPEACMNLLKTSKERGSRADIFTFRHKIPGSAPKFPYQVEMESVAAAECLDYKAWWESLPQESRKNVRRSQKRGVSVRIVEFGDELIRGIAAVNNESPTRQGRPNAHYGKSLDQVRRDHESFLDRCDFFCAYFEDQMIGYLKLVYRGEVAAILNLAVMASHSDKRPANALVAVAMQQAATRGVAHVTYGLYNYGNKQDSPLREFKERNGFREALTPKYYIPLTLLGRVFMKLGFHRGILGILPHKYISFGIAIRTKWYTFKNTFSKPV